MAGPKATKKSATPTKVAKTTQKYEYTELAKVSLTTTDFHNVYGVIIDATFPHKVNQEKYVCTLKIVDPSLHQKGNKAGDNDYATVVIFAKKFEDLPIAHRVGDIIRIHRATLRIYKGVR
jgi:stress-induced morphogen